jgi:hypothetical protein
LVGANSGKLTGAITLRINAKGFVVVPEKSAISHRESFLKVLLVYLWADFIL